jgi:FKBP-type peptidyl-prolyl cis-trans isomerase
MTDDKEIVKETTLKGQGKRTEAGDILAIEYAAYVQGSSKPFAKGDKEKFTFKDGSTIKGWDIAVASMRIGEKAKFIISPKYAYGAKGVGSIVPPGSTVSICYSR